MKNRVFTGCSDELLLYTKYGLMSVGIYFAPHLSLEIAIIQAKDFNFYKRMPLPFVAYVDNDVNYRYVFDTAIGCLDDYYSKLWC